MNKIWKRFLSELGTAAAWRFPSLKRKKTRKPLETILLWWPKGVHGWSRITIVANRVTIVSHVLASLGKLHTSSLLFFQSLERPQLEGFHHSNVRGCLTWDIKCGAGRVAAMFSSYIRWGIINNMLTAPPLPSPCLPSPLPSPSSPTDSFTPGAIYKGRWPEEGVGMHMLRY